MTQTLIIGGGLSGLALASVLEARDHDYILIEARNRLGGRILSAQHEGAAFDMGPAWFWPEQPRIEALVRKFDLDVFTQHTEGLLTYEDQNGRVQHGQNYMSMPDSFRLKDGLASLINELSKTIPPDRIQLSNSLRHVSCLKDGIRAQFQTGTDITAQKIVLAMPPRVATQVSFEPNLPAAATQSMRSIPTWMAGQAKVMILYDTPFWRHAGLSGQASSQIGPMVEIHDASPAQNGPFALFGFIGVPPHARQDESVLRSQIKAQLIRLFGKDAPSPREIILKDWSRAPYTAIEADQEPLYSHPVYGMPKTMTNLYDGKILFAGTEVAPQFGGYIEGALEAAENALRMLQI